MVPQQRGDFARNDERKYSSGTHFTYHVQIKQRYVAEELNLLYKTCWMKLFFFLNIARVHNM